MRRGRFGGPATRTPSLFPTRRHHASTSRKRPGEDRVAEYPPGRWGCNFQVSPDSRFVVTGGGPGFDRLYAVNIEQLRSGWNEHPICNYPHCTTTPGNGGPFVMPFVLPDGSGVIFNAGWTGPDHGINLAQWPAGL